MLRSRRGVSLVELLIAIIIMGIVGAATTGAFMRMIRGSTAQVKMAASQGEARIGSLLLPQELREIGYDTNTIALSATSDLTEIAGDYLRFFASRGTGVTCGTPTLTDFRVRRGVIGQRPPSINDRVLLFLEFDPNSSTDDMWVPMVVSAIDLTSTCGADPAIKFTLTTAPLVDVGLPMALTNQRVGGPIRWFEEVEYGVQTVSGEDFLGRRSVSLSQANYSPVLGPLRGTAGLTFRYYDATGILLDPTVASPLTVRSIEVRLTTVTQDAVSLGGGSNRAISEFPLLMRVSLRNALRP
jgi:prepilin-type N-terminal cleavage/methylation domain-containing protein